MRTSEGVYFAYMGRRNPWTDRIQILFADRDPGHNHVYQICWRSVKGFLVGGVPKFALSHRLWSSSLQQCYATACTVMWLVIKLTSAVRVFPLVTYSSHIQHEMFNFWVALSCVEIVPPIWFVFRFSAPLRFWGFSKFGAVERISTSGVLLGFTFITLESWWQLNDTCHNYHRYQHWLDPRHRAWLPWITALTYIRQLCSPVNGTNLTTNLS